MSQKPSLSKIPQSVSKAMTGYTHGQLYLTRQVANLNPDMVAKLLRQVRTFDMFTPDNDPYGEHDFGAFDLGGQGYFWKIDYYDVSMTYGSEVPHDPAQTRRVLTVMMADEY